MSSSAVASSAASRKRSLAVANGNDLPPKNPICGLPPLPTHMHNPDGFRIGSIIRVKMLNFMIYSLEEMRPGPGLNLLIGPNGSGKSTVVSAIGIGLGGDPKSVGRHDSLAGYVKAGETKAMVEVELFRGSARGSKNLIIRREFDSTHADKSTFSMGDSLATLKKDVPKKDVQAEMKRLNIQINNLCVYLAQFRVGEFAELNSAGLLEETEKSADPKLYDQHQSMIQDQTSLKKKAEAAAGSKKQADTLLAEVKSMESEMKAQEERQETERRIELLKKRRPWCRVEEQEEKVKSLAKYKEDKRLELEAEKKKHLPLQKAVKDKEKAVQKAKQAEAESKAAKSAQKAKRVALNRTQINCEEASEKCEEEIHQIEFEELERVNALKKERATLIKLESELSQLRSPADIQKDLAEVEGELHRLRREDLSRSKESNELQQKIIETTTEYRQLRATLETLALKPVITPKTKLMRVLGGGRATAEKEDMLVTRLRADGKLTGKVYGPLLSLLEVEDPHCASYLETVITGKMRTAYVVETEADLRTLRAHGFRTIIQAPPLTERPKRPYPTQFRLDENHTVQIRYLDDAVKCDDIVRSACYDAFRLADLVYTDKDLSSDELERLVSSKKGDGKIRSLFMPHASYSTSSTAWSTDIAVRINQIRPAIILGGAVEIDPNRVLIDETKAKLDACQHELEGLQEEKKKLVDEIAIERIQRLKATTIANERTRTLQNERRLRVTLATRMDGSRAKVSELEKRSNGEAKKKELEKKLKQLEDKREAAVMEVMDCDEQITQADFAYCQAQLTAFHCEQELIHLKDHVESLATADKRLQRALEEATKEFQDAERKKGELIRIARAECEKSVFDACTEWMKPDINYNGATALLDEYTAQLDRHIGDPLIKDRFQRTSKLLQEAQLRSALDQTELTDLEGRIKHLKETWLVAVQEMVKTIDAKFSSYFARIGCMGNVELATENDNYGIDIKVSFRQGVTQHKLSATAQSGGEKSVSTMLYLLCLQEVTNSPFRMVDEINQGMDANNERTVFDQIVASCQPREAPRRNEQKMLDSDEEEDEEAVNQPPQYFVVTPKLLPNLNFSRRVTIFPVYNGSHMMPQSDCVMEQFLTEALSGRVEEVYKIQKRRRHQLLQQAKEEQQRNDHQHEDEGGDLDEDQL